MSDLSGFFYPRTATGRSSLLPEPPWHYSGDLLTVEYRTDPARVAELLPGSPPPRGTPARCLSPGPTGSPAATTALNYSSRFGPSTPSASPSSGAVSPGRSTHAASTSGSTPTSP